MKRICMLLSMVMLLTSITVTIPIGVFADEASVKVDFFDTSASLEEYSQTNKNALITVVNDSVYGNVFLAETGSAATSKGLRKSIGTTGVNTGKIIFGADVKVEDAAQPNFGFTFTTTDGEHMAAWVATDKNASFTRGDGGGLANLGDSKYDTGTKPDGTAAAAAVKKAITPNKWTKVEVVVDFDAKSRALYVDGKQIDFRGINDDSSLFSSIYNKKITGFSLTTRNLVATGENPKDDIYFANIRMAQIPSETTVKSSISGNDIYLWYNTAAKEDISDLTVADVEVQNVENRANKLTVSSVAPMGQSGVKFSLSNLDSAAAGEYRVVINKEIHDIFGNDMSKALFYKGISMVSFSMMDKNFEDGNAGTDKATVVDESDNKVLSVPTGVSFDYGFSSEYNDDNNSVKNKSITTSYRAKVLNDYTYEKKDYFRLMEMFGDKPEQGGTQKNPTIISFAKANASEAKSQFIVYEGASAFEGGAAWKGALLDVNKWYNFSRELSYGTASKAGTAHYTIKDDDGTVIFDEVTQIAGEEKIHEKPYYLSSIRIFNPTTATVLVDDLKVTQSYAVPAIKSVRFVDVNGTKYAPDATLPNDITKIEVTADGSGVTADSFTNKVKLNGAVKSGTFDADTNTYTIDLGGILAPTTEYTLTIDEMTDVNIPAYSTSFTTGEGSFKITDIKIVDESGNAVALANVTKDTKLKVVVEGINTTGSEKSAVVSYGIYNDKMLTGFDFAPITFESTGIKIIKELNVGTITDVNNLAVKGFVWDSMKVMTPQSDFAELK